MPVSLIPQQRPLQRSPGESLKSLTGGSFFVSLSIFVLVAVIISYIGLTVYQSRLNGTLQKDNEDYTQLQQNLGTKDQAQSSDFAQRSQRIKTLLAGHVDTDPFFFFLENYTHKQVTWTNLSFNFSNAELGLQGTAAGYQSVAEQMVLWQKNSIVHNVSVSGFSIGNDGLLKFSADVLLSPETFKPSSP